MLRGETSNSPTSPPTMAYPDNRINSILQDRRGFMWFATEDGLNRYDGNTFVVYKNNPNDPNS